MGKCFNLRSVGGKFSSSGNLNVEDPKKERIAFAKKLQEVLDKYHGKQLPSEFDCVGGGREAREVMSTMALM